MALKASLFLWLAYSAITSAQFPEECGTRNSESKIVGGGPVEESISFFARLTGKYACGGALITDYCVLTAAHCFDQNGAVNLENQYNVTLGDYNICNANEPTRKKFTVSSAKVHPKFRRASSGFDIAIVCLSEAAEGYTPVCLPEKNSDLPNDGTVIGFGTTQFGTNNGPCVLQGANITIYSVTECQNSDLPNRDATLKGTFCAGKMEGGVDTCQGDSGGPLYMNISDIATILGITSYGFGCASKGLPGIYTSVPHYIHWIKRTVKELQKR